MATVINFTIVVYSLKPDIILKAKLFRIMAGLIHILISGSNKIKLGENIRQFDLLISDVYRISNPFGSCFEDNFASTRNIYKPLTRNVWANGKSNYSHSTFKSFQDFPVATAHHFATLI